MSNELRRVIEEAFQPLKQSIDELHGQLSSHKAALLNGIRKAGKQTADLEAKIEKMEPHNEKQGLEKIVDFCCRHSRFTDQAAWKRTLPETIEEATDLVERVYRWHPNNPRFAGKSFGYILGLLADSFPTAREPGFENATAEVVLFWYLAPRSRGERVSIGQAVDNYIRKRMKSETPKERNKVSNRLKQSIKRWSNKKGIPIAGLGTLADSEP